jgi:ABC-type transporter Mla maintaining outer membrane lipid asymmetry ATPase subunit MlaF
MTDTPAVVVEAVTVTRGGHEVLRDLDFDITRRAR